MSQEYNGGRQEIIGGQTASLVTNNLNDNFKELYDKNVLGSATLKSFTKLDSALGGATKQGVYACTWDCKIYSDGTAVCISHPQSRTWEFNHMLQAGVPNKTMSFFSWNAFQVNNDCGVGRLVYPIPFVEIYSENFSCYTIQDGVDGQGGTLSYYTTDLGEPRKLPTEPVAGIKPDPEFAGKYIASSRYRFYSFRRSSKTDNTYEILIPVYDFDTKSFSDIKRTITLSATSNITTTAVRFGMVVIGKVDLESNFIKEILKYGSDAIVRGEVVKYPAYYIPVKIEQQVTGKLDMTKEENQPINGWDGDQIAPY